MFFENVLGPANESGDTTALGGSNLINCSKSATTLLWYRIDTIDSLRFPNRAHRGLFPQAARSASKEASVARTCSADLLCRSAAFQRKGTKNRGPWRAGPRYWLFEANCLPVRCRVHRFLRANATYR